MVCVYIQCLTVNFPIVHSSEERIEREARDGEQIYKNSDGDEDDQDIYS